MREKFNLKLLGERVARLEQRVSALENKGSPQSQESVFGVVRKKPQALTELRRRAEIKNGQQAVTIIIGYYEKISNQKAIPPKAVEEGWREGKFNGKYNPEFLRRAIADGLIRPQKDGLYDLSGSGEDFFQAQLTRT